MTYKDYKTKDGEYDIERYLEENDPRENNNIDIRMASVFGNTKVVKALLKDPRVDPTANDNEAIKVAHQNGYHDIFILLLKHGCKLYE